MPHPTPDPVPAGADPSNYQVQSRPAVVALLRALCKAASQVTAYLDDGRDFMLTSILEVRAEQDELIIDVGADAATNQRALKIGRASFVTALDHVQIRFAGESLRPTEFQGRAAFSLALPQSVLRLQRRETFRAPVPLARRPSCVLASDQSSTRVTVVDISCGGMAVTSAEAAADLQPGACFRGCRIQLPGGGEVTTDILVRSRTEVTLKNGSRQLRIGCEFVAMSPHDQAKVQVCVSKMERERMVAGRAS